jgi:hypothetical protein
MTKDPRLEEEIVCRTDIADSIFGCNKICLDNRDVPYKLIDMGDEDAIFTDRLCHFKLDFWNVTLSNMVEDGIRIEPLDAYSRRHLKIYISDMYLGPTIMNETSGEVLEETFNPLRSELENYRIQLSRDKLS